MVGKGFFVHYLFLFWVSSSLVLGPKPVFQWNALGTHPAIYCHQKEPQPMCSELLDDAEHRSSEEGQGLSFRSMFQAHHQGKCPVQVLFSGEIYLNFSGYLATPESVHLQIKGESPHSPTWVQQISAS